jgi:fatty acid desaturase
LISLSLFHCAANEQGADEDIATDPFLFAYAPDPSQDSPLRKIQHIIFPITFSFMFALWRYDSLKVTIEAVEKNRKGAKAELYSLLAHYFVLFTVFPAVVWIPAVFMSGLVSALIVTPTHQSEEMFDEYQSDWVTAQFQSTRNAVTTNPVSEWIWGGMQYQLEHHLFPSMPRNKVSYSFQKYTLAPHCATSPVFHFAALSHLTRNPSYL